MHGVAKAGFLAVALSLWLASSAAAADGTWERAWGKDVVTGGATGAEICVTATACKAGVNGTLGGEFATVTGVAADAFGNVYVADTTNHRVQKFDSAGNFLLAWGRDVVTGGPTGFEVCTAASTCKEGLTGTLGGEFNSPASIAVDGVGNVYVAESANLRVQKFDPSGNFLRAWGKDVDTGVGTGFEICTVAASCKIGVVGTLGGEFGTNGGGVGTDNAGNVYVAEAANDRVQKFDPSGNFLRAWGKDVDTGGGTGFEICTVPANCKAGVIGPLGGELTNPVSVTGDGSTVWVGDQGGDRIQRFDASGNFQRLWGKDVDTAAGTGFEICTAAASCKDGLDGSQGGEFESIGGVTLAGGTVYVSDGFLDRVQQFDLNGNWLRAWGKNVVTGGATGFEICAVATTCKTGEPGDLAGEFNGLSDIEANATNAVFTVESSNHRVQAFAGDPVAPPSDPGGGDTAAPETTITAGPKSKTRKKTASFGFTSSEPGSAFQCRLDGGAFEPCTSPESVKVKKGRHTFEVRAIDAAGNVDPTAATRSWKVKKKKKKKKK
jgi:uncharacterized protein (DUF2147 family)